MNTIKTMDSPVSQYTGSNKVLRDTYRLLGLTIFFSAFVGYLAIQMNVPPITNPIIILGVFAVIMFGLNRALSGPYALFAAFGYTGFLGYLASGHINAALSAGAGSLVVNALLGTAIVVSAMSVVGMSVKGELKLLRTITAVGGLALIVMALLSLFIPMSGIHFWLNVGFIVFSSSVILLQTKSIIDGGETNYVAAAVSLYASTYNIFISLLSLGGDRE